MLELSGEHIGRLGDEDLRLLVIKLCEAELRRNGQPSSALLAGGNQTAIDGGVDVRVQLPSGVGNLDFIKRPNTVFQVKCEDMPAKAIAKEMRPGGVLRDSIKELIAHSGAYVIVSSKGTVSETFLRKRLQAMRDAIKDQPELRSWRSTSTTETAWRAGCGTTPAPSMWLRERVNDRLQGWQGFGPWAGAGAGEPYLHDESTRLKERVNGGAPTAMSVAGGIDRLRAILGSAGNVSRIVGLSGTGKTRLVQALFEQGVGEARPLDQALVMYTDIGNSPEPSAREMLLRLGALEQRAIVVVDNCNPETHLKLTEVVRQHPHSLSLLTVEYDVAEDDSPEGTDVFELEPATEQVLDRILARLAPQLTSPDRTRIVEFSGGNARIALALARTVERGETLGVLNDAELFRRLFRQGQADSPELLRAAEACSLVYSFEGEDLDGETSELRALAGLAGMTSRELYRHVETLRRRDLVQVRGRWRALLPPALANRLAKSALRNIPRADILTAVAASERLLVSMTRRLQYLHDTAEAKAIAVQWMDDENWLANPERLSEFGRKLFFNLAPVEPGKVLTLMERALVADKLPGFLTEQKSTLRSWATLLRHIAYEPQYFDRAAALLVTFADSEEGPSKEGREAFIEMFRIVLSGTLALPAQRVQVLERLLATASGKRQEVVWDALEAMLQAGHFNSSHDFSFGARLHGFGWQPVGGDEVAAWFEEGFRLVRRLASMGDQARKRARAAVTSHFRELWRVGVHQQLAALTRDLAADGDWPGGWVAVRTAMRFDGTGMPPEVLAELRALEQALAPRGLLQEIRTYTFGQTQGLMDVSFAIDESDEEESRQPIDSWRRVDEKVTALGAAAARDDDALQRVLPELLNEQAGRQYSFGLGLGQGSPDVTRHWSILGDAYKRAGDQPNVMLLSGFIAGVRAKDRPAASQLVDSIVGDRVLDALFPSLLGVTLDDADGDRLLEAMRRGVVKPHRVSARLAREELPGLSMAKFCEVVDALSLLEHGLPAAMDELGNELHNCKSRKVPVPAELVQLSRTLLGRFQFDERGHNVAWRVNEMATMALAGPEAAEVAAAFASRFAAAMSDYRTHSDDYGELASTLFRLQPTVALDAFFAKPQEKRHFAFRYRFIMRHGHIVEAAPEDVIMDWVRLAPAERAHSIAAEVDIIDKDSGGTQLSSLAMKLLDLLPDKAPVLTAFTRNFHPSYWSGSLGQTLAPYVLLLERLSAHPEQWLAAWAQSNLASMRERIEQERLLEMRHEQSFES